VDVAADVPDHAALDPRRVRQILFNLVGNALKFTEEGGISVTLTCEAGETLVFAVSDTGVGIAADDVPRLFEMFRQVDASDMRRFAGTGMGLAICQQLSDLMGGSISVESTLGRGSTFILRLPLEICEAPAQAGPAADAQDGEAMSLSILAADDNPTNLLVLEQLLGALGFQITKAGGGPEALDMLRAQAFDLVLMDIQMPEMTGIDVLQAVRSEPSPNAATPFIAVTADAMTLGAARYADLGFSGFVTKPIHAQSLINAMMAAMSEEATCEPSGQAATA
jgi:two-component system, sensor histidine kinase